MKNSIKLISALVFAGSCVALASSAQAQSMSQTGSGFYLSATGGWQKRSLSGESSTTWTTFKSGSQYSLAGGYRFGGLRLELEHIGFTNDTKTVASDMTGPADGSGKITGQAQMLNGYYDIAVPGWSVRPYVGIGFGQYSTTIKNLSNTVLLAVPPDQGGPFVVVSSKSDHPSAFQLQLGMNYAVTSALDLSFGYRYFKGGTLLFKGTPFGDLRPSGAKLNSISVGLSYSL
jgi:opacity protein-like surface antigen